jgi:primase-polymerase (primpol)-like protein
MTSRRRWVRRDGNKVPLTGAGRYASSTNSKTWASFEHVAKSEVGVGMGFVLGDGIGCWDFDHCFTGGKLADWAREALAAITERVIFTEVSQSGEGLHVFVEAPEAPGRKIRDGRNIEFYSAGRYIAVTGKPLIN